MKKRIIFVSIIAVGLLVSYQFCFAQTVVIPKDNREKQMLCLDCRINKETDTDNFRNLKWGAPIPKDFREVKRSGNYMYCKKNNEKLEILGKKVKSIEYSFYQNRFERVIILLDNHTSIGDELRKYFGKPFSEEYGGEEIKTIWKGDIITTMWFITGKTQELYIGSNAENEKAREIEDGKAKERVKKGL